MLTKRLLLSSLLWLAACSDDDKKSTKDDDVDAAVEEGTESDTDPSTDDEDEDEADDDEDPSDTGDSDSDDDSSADTDADTDMDMDMDSDSDMDDDMSMDEDMDGGMPTDMPTDMSETDDTPATPTNPQFPPCESDADCGEDGLCYVFGGYCGPVCEGDDDCAELGDNFSCSGTGFGGPPGNPQAPGNGPGRPGAMLDAGVAQAGAGVCRASCDPDVEEQACPEGMACVERGFGGARCAYVEPEPARPEPASVAAFYECYTDEDCRPGLGCTTFSESDAPGYCAELCRRDEDCAAAPEAGEATASCNGRNLCALSCDPEAEGDGGCPDGMLCNARSECYIADAGSRVANAD